MQFENVLASLNPPQKQAASHTTGPLLVLAGAGTGKTRVLTTRIANLLHVGICAPQNILAVTFTNKAAREMQERIEDLIGQSAGGMWLGTFHRLGVRWLRQHAEYVGLRPDFTILDTDDQKRILQEILKDNGIDTTAHPPRMLASIISSWKDNAWRPEDVARSEDSFAHGRGIGLYQQYQKRLQALNACDFGDLLLHPVHLFKQNPDILAHYQHKLTHILVDEYQDTNTVQYLLLRLLTQKQKNICVVGDDDQSIYGWRGAQVENILRFEKDFPGADVVRLEQNYRSTGYILDAASALIACNNNRHSKTLWTSDDKGQKVEVHPVMDDREESRFVAEACDTHVREGGAYTDCAVLVRSNAQTRSLEEQFIKSGVPYIVVGGLKFYDRKEVRDAIAYLRLIYNTTDDLAFQRIVNVPRRGVGESAMQAIQKNAQGGNLLHATLRALEYNEISGKAKTALTQFCDMLQAWQNLGAGLTPDRMMEQILNESGYLSMLQAEMQKNPEDTKNRIDNLKELVRAMQDYSDVGTFLEHVSLVTDGEDATDEAVRLMTIHAAKGLEFDTVFLPGFEEGVFPHQRSLNESGVKGIEEERRLAYVAITRARRRLLVLYTSSRRLYGQFQPSSASRFLAEIPQECLDVKPATHSNVTRPQWGSRLDERTAGTFARPAEPMLSYVPIDHEIDGFDFYVGGRVFHQKFGYGNILKADGDGLSARLTIQFDKAGTKTLVAGMANLQAA